MNLRELERKRGGDHPGECIVGEETLLHLIAIARAARAVVSVADEADDLLGDMDLPRGFSVGKLDMDDLRKALQGVTDDPR